jgi:hypothetical protein
MGRESLGKPNIGSQKNAHVVSCAGKVPSFYATKAPHGGSQARHLPELR